MSKIKSNQQKHHHNKNTKNVKYRKSLPRDMKYPQHSFKINLSGNQHRYCSGNGEGVWVVPLTKKDFLKHEKMEENGYIKVMLLSDSIYYPQLSWGSVVLARLRGKNRPVLSRKHIRRWALKHYKFFIAKDLYQFHEYHNSSAH